MDTTEQKFHVELTEKDYLIYQTDHNQAFKTKRWVIYFLPVFIVILFSFIPIMLGSDFSISQILGVLPMLIPGVLIGSVFLLLRARSKHSFRSDSFANHPYDVTITDREIIVHGYGANINCAWEDIYRYSKTKNAIYIYVSDLKSIIIPLRYFQNGTELENLIPFLDKKIKPLQYNARKRKTKIVRLALYLIPILIVLAIVFIDFGSDATDKQKKAIEFENIGDYQKAKSIYTELISEFPKDEYYLLARANCEMALNESPQAILDCEKAIELNPKSGQAYYYYAYALNNNKKHEAACAAMNKSKKLGFKGDSEGFCEDIKDTLNL